MSNAAKKNTPAKKRGGQLNGDRRPYSGSNQGAIQGKIMAQAFRTALRGPGGAAAERRAVDATTDAIFGGIRAAGQRSNSGRFNDIAMSMCLPSVAPPVRGAVGVSSRPTALMTPFEKVEATLAQSSATNGQGGHNDALFYAAFRQFSRANVSQVLLAGSSHQDLQSLSEPTNAFQMVPGALPMQFAQDAAGPVPSHHGLIQFALRAPDGTPVIWIDSPTGTSEVDFAPALPFLAANSIIARKYNGDVYSDTLHTTTGALVETVNLTAGSGYYAFILDFPGGGIDPSNDLAIVIKTNMSGTAYGYAHTVLPGLLANVMSFTSGRINAVSLMLSNYSTELAKRGRVTGWTAPEASDWTQYASVNGSFLGATPNPYNIVNSQLNSCDMTAKDGMYAFLLPTDNAALNFVPLTEGEFSNAGAINIELEPLLPVDGFIVIVADVTCPSAAPSVTDDRTFVRTSCYHVEAHTGDPWRVTDFANIKPSQYLDDLSLLRTIPTFHSNKWHFAEIARKVSNIAGWAQPLLAAAGAIGGPVGAPLLALSNVAGAIHGLGDAFLPAKRGPNAKERRRMNRLVLQ